MHTPTLPEEQNRYLCQFRDLGAAYFRTDCAFSNVVQAAHYIDTVIQTLGNVEEGQVIDNVTHKIIYHRGWK